jgi:hypothetical protein
VRLFRTAKPIVGAIHGAAVGGGLGLALVPDLRVTCPEARFSRQLHAARLPSGLRPDPHAAGAHRAVAGGADVLHSRRIAGDEAVRMGLADVLVPQAEVRAAAQKLAKEIAECSPLGVLATRATMRAGLADRVRAATDKELAEQTGCARPPTSRKASTPSTSGGCPSSWALAFSRDCWVGRAIFEAKPRGGPADVSATAAHDRIAGARHQLAGPSSASASRGHRPLEGVPRPADRPALKGLLANHRRQG